VRAEERANCLARVRDSKGSAMRGTRR
jgi:hypothetical protein